MSAREKLNAIASQRILVLDGAMGSMIQKQNLGEDDFRGRRFAGHPMPLLGCNDLLCLTRPEAISAIHEAYLAAGADIISACSFNSTAVSLADYGLEGFAYEISAAAAALARKAADTFSTADKPRFVAGSIGPTGKSASLSSHVDDPARCDMSVGSGNWDELEAAFYDNARGLLDGGADILLLETIFDTLNAKAALFAIRRLLEERNIDIPIMISVTVSGGSGRLLAGQTLEAFCASVLHASPWAVGLNCSFGAEKLLPHLRRIAAIAPCLVSAHPNAGLPNQFGGYDESPHTMAALVERYLQDGLLNIVGGCCGSTPDHIAAIAEKAALYQPRTLPSVTEPSKRRLTLAGLEPLTVDRSHLILTGERTNVAGSKKFLRLIREEKFNEALALTRSMIEDGAEIICVGMDDAMLDAETSMCAFLGMALSDPEIARVPVMIDSSRWNVLEAGLKRLQGKGIVNSINLKDGEEEFLLRAALVRRYGAAVVVMLIDEKGQAVSYERKIEIAARAYRLLVATGFPPENIVFDPNVLAVATGISEHDSCALDFIRACEWIRDNCPGVQISGGISNLSYSFRGNNPVREAMHSVFLYHARAAGLTMAIVNPAAMIAYNDIEENLRNAVEDAILNRRPDATDRLLELIGTGIKDCCPITEQHSSFSSVPGPRSLIPDPRSRIINAVIRGIDDSIEADVLELKDTEGLLALEIVEGPLMDGMKEVGKRFDDGTMYLPQVIRSAMVMKKAAAALEPFMQKNNAAVNAPKIILATVKGDVHDIGKNIVGIVLACNGCHIIDLGVMVPAEQILETAEKEQAAIIGLSALISPSLDEMAHVAREMEKRRMQIPLLIGGAAASLIHTALRIFPEYSGPVVYVPNAGKSAETVRSLLSDTERPRFLQGVEKNYQDAVRRHEAIQSGREMLLPEAARSNKVPPAAYTPTAPKITGIIDLNNYPLDKVIPHIDWQAFSRQLDISRKSSHRDTETQRHKEEEKDAVLWKQYPNLCVSVPLCEEEGRKVIKHAQALLERVAGEGLLQLRGVAGIFPAASDGEDVVIGDSHRFCFFRNQQKKPDGKYNPCLADFVKPLNEGPDWLGLFALSAGFGIDAAAEAFRRRNDDYNALLLESLANALAEAFAEEIHLRIRREWWGYAPNDSPTGIRPAFGYPSCPNHEDKRIAFELLEAEKRCGMRLTETAMIIPAASVCGMYFASPAAYYFGLGYS
ncbi:MAG: methionine synthase [Treponema sp.]|nr:methionine synthase [Treponema sp.]